MRYPNAEPVAIEPPQPSWLERWRATPPRRRWWLIRWHGGTAVVTAIGIWVGTRGGR